MERAIRLFLGGFVFLFIVVMWTLFRGSLPNVSPLLNFAMLLFAAIVGLLSILITGK